MQLFMWSGTADSLVHMIHCLLTAACMQMTLFPPQHVMLPLHIVPIHLAVDNAGNSDAASGSTRVWKKYLVEGHRGKVAPIQQSAGTCLCLAHPMTWQRKMLQSACLGKARYVLPLKKGLASLQNRPVDITCAVIILH